MDKEKKKYIFAQLRSLPNATQYVEVTKYIEHLEQQCKKQKEIINKAIEWVRDWTHGANDWFEEDSKPSELLDILKGSNSNV